MRGRFLLVVVGLVFLGSGCFESKKTPEICTPGDRRCNSSGEVERCNPEGTDWEYYMRCNKGEVCSGGKCVELDAGADGAAADTGTDLSADTLVPDTLVPDAPVPDAAWPDAVLPDAATPDVASPDTALPDAALPDAFSPDAASSVTKLTVVTGREVKGLAYDAGYLWATLAKPGSGGNLTKIGKIDPLKGTVVLQSPADLSWNGRGITVGAGYLWVSDAKADVIHKVDPSTLADMGTFKTPGTEPGAMGFDGTDLWLLDGLAKKAYELSTTGTTLSSFTLPPLGQRALEWDNKAGGMWITSGDVEISLYTTGGVVKAKRAYQGIPTNCKIHDVAIGGGKIYISIFDTATTCGAKDTIFVTNW